MANRSQAKKNAAAAVNKEAAKKEVKTTVAEETAEKVTAVEKVAEKAAEVKEAVKEKVAEVKETTKAAKAAKAETAEKAEPKKTPGRKAAVKEEFVLEFAGKQITQEEIKKKVKENHIKEPADCRELLINSIKEQMYVGDTAYRFEEETSVVLVIGVNGVGKTTTNG